MPQSRRWLPFGTGPAEAEARMFCLPFAGGGASNFTRWVRRMPDVAIVPVQYPGHETRIDEAPYHCIEQMLDALADAIAPLLDRPYMLFGYSMGARLAFGLIHRLVQRGHAAPLCLMVAAHRAPDRVSSAAGADALPDPELRQVLRNYGGMPDELFDDDDFCAMMLPLMRADFGLAMQAVELSPVACPIIAYAGIEDSAATPLEMAQWQRFTSSQFRLREFEGGHFFLRTAAGFEAALHDDIVTALRTARDQRLVFA